MPATSLQPPAQLALVLPCYHPPLHWATNILTSLARLRALLPADTTLHLYVVNDGDASGVSPADLDLLTQQLPGSFTYLTYALNQGKGHALRTGISQVEEPYCLFTDIDFPYQETSVAALYQVLLAGADVAVGVRDDAYYAQIPPARRRVSRLLRRLTRHVLRLPVDDTQCGLKGFNAAGRRLFLRTTTKRYLFDLEMLFLAARRGELRVVPLPVELKPDVVFSRLNPRILLTESLNFVRILGRRLDD
ncbi:glycosyltransferase [Hymenobacter sp. NST-14]|uniref:glycosyltransferase n=1 Tax=Hymenobacter piscis TaxID=2839984 RepID=UPI001C01A62C|nr:glycosyltransferase [Hymenobacter piscis]MBT9392993.1 glycosyltransferase [Hymenobacter piscis]